MFFDARRVKEDCEGWVVGRMDHTQTRPIFVLLSKSNRNEEGGVRRHSGTDTALDAYVSRRGVHLHCVRKHYLEF